MSRTTVIACTLVLFLSLPPSLQESFSQQTAGQLYEQALYLEEGKGDLRVALEKYQTILKQFPGERSVGAQAQLHIGLCLEKQGLKEATGAYQKVIADYPDQKQAVGEARTRLAALRRYAGEPASRKMTVKKVWEGPDVDDTGEISPDGKYLSYVDWDTGNLAVYEIATGTKRSLTKEGTWDSAYAYALGSRWSPNGRQIVYMWHDTQSEELRITDLNGSSHRTLCSTDENIRWFDVSDWTTDGKSVLAVRRLADSTCHAVLISVDDGTVKVVGKLDKISDIEMRMSFDGRYIAYDCPTREGSVSHDIFLLNRESGESIPLITNAGHDRILGWAPDGKHLLFSSERTGIPAIWTIRIVEGRPSSIPIMIKETVGPFMPGGLGSTSDGLFYFSEMPNKTDVFVTEIDPVTGRLVSPPKEAINRFVGSNATPDYSPDGKHLAYASGRGALMSKYIFPPVGNVLCIRSLETGTEREINPGLSRFGFPKWSPDNRTIMVVNFEPEKGRVCHYLVDTQTGEVKLAFATVEPEQIYQHEWSADGKSVYLVRGEPVPNGERSVRLVVRNLGTGSEEELFRGSERDLWSISRSPDGRWLAFLNRGEKRSLGIIPAGGGEPRVIYSFDKGGNSAVFHTWTADGKYVIMPRLRSQRDKLLWDLWRIPVDGGEPHNLGLQTTYPWQLTAHADGRHIAFSSQGPTHKLARIWVMENFIPEEGIAGEASTEPMRDASGMRLRKVANIGRTVYSQQLWLQGHISPDGKYLSCTDWETGDLALFEVETGQMHRLTNKGSWKDSSSYAESSIWSPDGKQIAYFWDSSIPALCVINADGSNSRVILRDTNLVWIDLYDWSPSGGSILTLVQKKDDTRAIALVSTANGSTHQILELSPRDLRDLPVSMSFSPDGQKIVYDLRADKDVKGHDIFVHSIGDGKHFPLVTHPADDYVLGWTRDGRGILFTSSRTGTYGLWAIAVEGAKARGEAWLVTPDIGAVTPVGFTRDGSLYYSPPFGNTPDVYTIEYNLTDGTVVTPPVKVIKDVEGTSVHPEYSSCGKYLAYVSGHSYRKGRGGNVLCIRSLETGMTQEFRPKLPRVGFPRWSRDSRSLYLLVVDEDSKIIGIHRMDTRDGQITPVVTSRPGELRGHISTHDGKSIILARQDGAGAGWRITVRDLEGETEKELYHAAKEQFYAFGISPDGKQLAILSRALEAKILEVYIRVGPTSGGELKELCRPDKVARELTWTADGSHILFCRQQPSSEKWGLWRAAADGGEAEDLHTEMIGEMIHLTAHPNGKWIAFSAQGPIRNAELWAIDNIQQELETKQR